MTYDQLVSFFGWSTVVHFVALGVATLVLVAFRSPISRLHARLLGVSEAEMTRLYVWYLSGWKLLAITFAFVPWLTLWWLMG